MFEQHQIISTGLPASGSMYSYCGTWKRCRIQRCASYFGFRQIDQSYSFCSFHFIAKRIHRGNWLFFLTYLHNPWNMTFALQDINFAWKLSARFHDGMGHISGHSRRVRRRVFVSSHHQADCGSEKPSWNVLVRWTQVVRIHTWFSPIFPGWQVSSQRLNPETKVRFGPWEMPGRAWTGLSGGHGVLVREWAGALQLHRGAGISSNWTTVHRAMANISPLQ